MIAIADTSFVLAYMNKTDARHRDCQEVLKAQQQIILPQTTLSEIAYMLGRSGGNLRVAYFLKNLPAVARFVVVSLDTKDFLRTAGILEKYADSRIDFVDATIAAVAERLNITRILTLDQRDFQILRPQHISRFELLP